MQDDDGIWVKTGHSSGDQGAASAGLTSQELALNPKEANPAELLFGKDALDADQRVIAVLDPAKLFGLSEMIDTYDLTYIPLFQEIAGDTTPFLVQLEPESRLTRQLLDGGQRPTARLHAETGIFFRTTMDLTALRKHLRRLMRVTDRTGSVYFFRFWVPWSALCYFNEVAESPEAALHWFKSVEGDVLGEVLIPDPAGARLVLFSHVVAKDAIRPHVPFRLSASEFDALQNARLRQDLRKIVDLIGTTFPKLHDQLGQERLEKDVYRSIRRMQEFGIRQRDNLMRGAVWDLHSHGQVEARDAEGTLRRILESDTPETEKMIALTERISQLDQTASPGRLG